MMFSKFSGYARDGRRRLPFDIGGDAPPPPDYTPVANASAETARISGELGQKQLDEAKRQYDNNMLVAKPIVDAQAEVMRQGITQGNDYYNYMVEKARPVENALQADALKDNTQRDADERTAITNAQTKLAGDITSIGGRQLTAGNQFADDLGTGLGGVSRQYGTSVQDALGRMDTTAAGVATDMRSALDRANAVAGGIRSNSAGYEDQINKDIGLYTSGNDAIREKYGKDIESDAALAVTDARTGQSNATNSAIRQAMRYGLNTSSIASDQALQNAQAQAAAANNTRVASTNKYRDVVGQGIGMRQGLMNSSNAAAIAAGNADINAAGMGATAAQQRMAAEMARGGLAIGAAGKTADMDAGTTMATLGARKDAQDQGFATDLASADLLSRAPGAARDMRIADDARTTGQRMDVAGLYRGMPGASQGAYGVAVNAGNSANGNNMAPGAGYMTGMNQGATTTLNGRQIAMQGLNGILSSQTSAYNAGQQADSGALGGFGSLLGGLGGLAKGGGLAAIFGSDPSYKTDVERVGTHALGIGVYSFTYKPEFAKKWGHGRHIGVMADEVARVLPEAVTQDGDGHTVVNYSLLQ